MRPSTLVLATLVVAVATGAAAEEAKLAPQLAALVEAERSFSRASVEHGVREAFLTYFGAESISFEPEPGPAIERIRAWPPPKRPTQLSWEPLLAGISSAGDMGYTTGPTRSEDLGPDPRPLRHGWYFSVWRKQGGGEWKVAIDAGIGTPGELTPKPELRAASGARHAAGKPEDVATARAEIFALEREPGTDVQHLAEEARLHRDGIFPVLGRDAVRADLAQRVGPTRGEPAEVVVSDSADLAYSYGSFTRAASKGEVGERGYYARVWKRAPEGDWQIVAQVEQAPG